MDGGQVETNQAFTTGNIDGGVLTHKAGAITTIVNRAATVIIVPAITITNYTGAAGSILDLSQGIGAVTLTNSTFYKGAKIIDPLGRLVTTNPAAWIQCGFKDLDIETGKHLTVQITRP
jgi:hypothetical protein